MLQLLIPLWENLPDWSSRLLPAAGRTLLLTGLSYVLALALAIVLEILRTRPLRILRSTVDAFINIVRGIPLLAILYLVYFALPAAGILLYPFEAGVIGLGIVYSAYLAEVLRAGISSLHKGQREAALAVGMPPAMAFRLIVLPQAIRVVLPPLLVTFISLLKDSSVCALIAVNELMLTSRAIMAETFLPLQVFVLVGAFYFFLAWPASIFVWRLEQRLSRGRKSWRDPAEAATAVPRAAS